VTTTVLQRVRHRVRACAGVGKTADDLRNSDTPIYARYSAPAHRTAPNQNGDADSSEPTGQEGHANSRTVAERDGSDQVRVHMSAVRDRVTGNHQHGRPGNHQDDERRDEEA
jgi:hypothetical protein